MLPLKKTVNHLTTQNLWRNHVNLSMDMVVVHLLELQVKVMDDYLCIIPQKSGFLSKITFTVPPTKQWHGKQPETPAQEPLGILGTVSNWYFSAGEEDRHLWWLSWHLIYTQNLKILVMKTIWFTSHLH